MAEKRNPPHHTGEQVIENIKRLRGAMQYKDLSERLTAIGRPIPPLGLRRIESGDRRVDVDDLMALAVVFDVSPLTLLLPENGSGDLASPMTGVKDREVAHNVQWLWASGYEPLQISANHELAHQERLKFELRARPAEVEERSMGTDVQSSTDEAMARLDRKLSIQGYVTGPEASDG